MVHIGGGGGGGEYFYFFVSKKVNFVSLVADLIKILVFFNKGQKAHTVVLISRNSNF